MSPKGQLISEPKLLKASGQILYDEAVDKAIRKSDPLPVDGMNRNIYHQFFREFKLRFTPEE